MEFIKSFIEKRFAFNQIALLVVFFSTLRILADWTLLDYPIEINLFQDFIRFYLENLYYFLILFIIISFMISKIVGKSITDVANVGIKFFPVIIIPPLIDLFFCSRTEG